MVCSNRLGFHHDKLFSSPLLVLTNYSINIFNYLKLINLQILKLKIKKESKIIVAFLNLQSVI